MYYMYICIIITHYKHTDIYTSHTHGYTHTRTHTHKHTHIHTLAHIMLASWLMKVYTNVNIV